jgi:predicted nucleotide-binding protein
MPQAPESVNEWQWCHYKDKTAMTLQALKSANERQRCRKMTMMSQAPEIANKWCRNNLSRKASITEKYKKSTKTPQQQNKTAMTLHARQVWSHTA